MYPYNNNPPYPGNSPGYPPQGNHPGYPPAPGSGASYPPSPFGNPLTGGAPQYPVYPGTSQSTPYPGASPAPYPGQTTPYPGVNPVPYPGAQVGFGSPGYPPATASPYPPAGSSPYPPAGQQQYYPAQGSIQSANAPLLSAGVSQVPRSSSPSYPSLASSSAYPTQQVASTSSPVHSGSGKMAYSQPYQEVPTIRDGPYDPLADAKALRKAMKGFGTDEKALIQVLCKRTNAQRVQIANSFKSCFGKDLVTDLKKETSGNFEDVLVALVTPRFDYMAERLHDAIDRIGTKESVLIDILCTSSNQELQWIQSAYYRLYNRTLEQDLSGDTSGCFRRLLISICVAQRIEDPNVHADVVSRDVNELYQAGVKKWGTDESVFNMILANRSYPHLRAVFHEYEVISGQDIEKTIKGEFSGDIEDALLAIVKCVKNRAAYFAERLRDSMKGFGTKDDQLIFIMVTRCEVDLESIKVEYNRLFNVSLAQDISNDTSGDYKKALLALLAV